MKALVTGGIAGLGLAVARMLAQEGHEVVVTSRRERAAGEIGLGAACGETGEGRIPADRPAGERIRAVRCDAGCREEVEGWLSREHDFDIWVHAVGPFRAARTPLADTSVREWEELVSGNLASAYWHARWIVPHMRSRRWGRIVTFGYPQVEGAMPWEGRGAYASAKVGLLAFTRTLAVEEAPHGITVNMICPGDIRAPFKEGTIAQARSHRDSGTPAGRPGTGEDVARVVRFLVHPDSDMITGSVIDVTGGVQYFPFTY
ncbi:MAG: SDR family oxidoreductase [Kyrpidia sp.]|nr:SDR family oxidoreductase [Kyrpidia sp.]